MPVYLESFISDLHFKHTLLLQALVLAPTRELAQQIQKVVIALGDYMGAQCHACIGGTSVREDMRKLDAGQHIVVGRYMLEFKIGV